MPTLKRKVVAYITRGNQLLVFEQPNAPEAGIQVPAGTQEPDETSADGALREAKEETGLASLELVRLLGEQTRDMRDYDKDEIHQRMFYHLLCHDETPATWEHIEQFPSDTTQGERHLFAFYWVALDNVPDLIADFGLYIDALRDSLNDEKTS